MSAIETFDIDNEDYLISIPRVLGSFSFGYTSINQLIEEAILEVVSRFCYIFPYLIINLIVSGLGPVLIILVLDLIIRLNSTVLS